MRSLQQAFALLDLFIEQQMLALGTPGMVVALTDRYNLLHVTTRGFADVTARTLITPDTPFEIGSISKSFTAIALLQLVQNGQVDLHAPVTHSLPWFHVPSRHPPITLHHLLSHTAGISRGTDLSAESRYEVWALREQEATTPPGTYYHYSNVGYKVLGLVLEELLGQTYDQIIQERILDPLAMAATEPVITHGTRKRLAMGYESFFDDRPAHPSYPLVPATWFEYAAADGSIATTAADLATYLRMLLNHGQGAQGHILSEEGFRLMTQRIIEPPEWDEDHGTFYGYGLNISEESGHTLIGHGGGMVGYYASMLADLDDGLGVVVLTNGPGEPGQTALFALRLLRAAHNNEELPPLPVAPNPIQVENAPDYAGTYRSEARTFTLLAEGKRLILNLGEEWIPLELRGEDRFYVLHPNFELFLLRFGRDQGHVVEAFHGSDWYTNDRYTGPTPSESPAEWQAYPGHYRAHNPWYTNFRVVLRKGALQLVEPSGDEEALVALGDGAFRVGQDDRSPEHLRFDTILDEQAVRANLSGCDYYRTFTP